MGDLFGRRKLLLVGISVFVAASLIAAAAPSGGVLLAGRLVQGVGGAMILPSTLSTVNAMFTGRERGIAFAIWGSRIDGMAAVGPLVGGWLATDFSWHWAFLINVPIGILIVVGTVLWVPETRDPHAERGVDAAGITLSIVGLAALVFSLIEGQRYGWWHTDIAPTVGSSTWEHTMSLVPFAFAIDVPVAESGQASGFQSTVRQLGAALGVAVLGTVLVTTLASATTSNLENVEGLTPQAQAELVAVVKGSAGAAIPSLSQMPGAGDAVQAAAEDAMVTAARVTTFGAAGALLVGLLATMGLQARNEHDNVAPATPVDVPAAD